MSAGTSQASQGQVPNHKADQSPEWRVLQHCASAHPYFSPLHSLTQHSVRWPLLLQLAQEHGEIPRLAEYVKKLDQRMVPPEVRSKLAELQRARTVFSLQLTAELFRVLEHFAEANIEVLITKGPALAVRCYGDPGMRQYGDLDLVLRESDIRRATQTMLDLAYQPRIPLAAIDAKKMTGEYAFRRIRADVLLEFHTERTFRYYPRGLQIENLFKRRAFVRIDGHDVPALSLEDELILICVHGAKHLWERLMWIADVAAIVSKQPVDWDLAAALAREAGAQRILRLALRLASDMLGAELPDAVKRDVRSDRTVEKLAAQMEKRLASHEPQKIALLERAVFRVRMGGGLFAGTAYLVRLSLSPTEEDWTAGKEGSRTPFVDAISRPFRLAKKYGRH